jgi:predicted nucleotide-binding protein
VESSFTMACWPRTRGEIKGVLSGKINSFRTSKEARVGEYIELYSTTNGAAVSPEPNCLSVIIRVSAVSTSGGIYPSRHVRWNNFVRKRPSHTDRTAKDNEFEILLALHSIGGDDGIFTPAEILAAATGIPLQDVKDHLVMLAEQDKVTCFATTNRTMSAEMNPRGRLYLKGAIMARKQAKSVPRRVFISHGRSEIWREVQDYVQREIGVGTLELAQEPSQGRTIVQKLDEESGKCGYARENVIHEIGFFQGRYGVHRVCLLYEEGANKPSNIHGLVYIGFPSGLVKAGFAELRREIVTAFQ